MKAFNGTYEEGFVAGRRGAIILTHPVNKDETKECEESSKAFKYCILKENPTLWEKGYMDGFNEVLEEKRKKKS